MSKKWITYNKILMQILYIGIFPLMFYLSAWFYLKDNFEQCPIIIIIILICSVIWAIFLSIYIWQKVQNRGYRFGLNTFYEHRYVIVLFIILLLFSFRRIFILPRWDALLYYSELAKRCNAFDFTAKGIIDGFRIVHPSQGYFCFLAIGYFLFDNPLVGTEFMSMLIYIISSLCYYGLLRIIFTKSKEWICFLGTLVYALNPLVYGIWHYISPDNGILSYLIILIYVSLKGYSLLELWVSVLLILSKETGVLYYMTFYGIQFLYNVIQSIKREHKLKWQDVNWILFRTIPGVIGIEVIMFWSSANPLGWMLGMQNVAAANKTSDAVIHGFGFNREYIIVKLKQIFLLNYIWVLWLILIYGIIRYLYHLKKEKQRLNAIAISLAGIEIVFLLFNIFFITYATPRYLSLGTFAVSLGAFWTVDTYIVYERFKARMLGPLVILVLISDFYSLDPISYLVWPTFKVSSGNYMYLPIYYTSDMLPSDIYADHTMYNCQNEYLTLLEEKMLRTIHYDGTIPLMEIDINKGQFEDPWKFDYVYMQLEGMYGRTTCFWDPDRGKFSENFSKKDTDVPMNVVYFNSEQFIDGGNGYRDTSLPDTAYILLLPRQDIPGILDAVNICYIIQETYDISLHGMSIYVYKAEKRK